MSRPSSPDRSVSRRLRTSDSAVDLEQSVTLIPSNGKSSTGYSPVTPRRSLLNIKKYSKTLSNYIPKRVTVLLYQPYIKYPLLIIILILLSALIGYTVFVLVDAGWFDPNVENKLMVVYSQDDTWFTKIQGAFSDFEAGVGAICYGIDHGAAAVKLVYNNRLYVEADRGDNYWEYFYKSNTFILKPHISPPYDEVHFNGWFGRYGQLGSFTREVIGHHRKPSNPYPVQPYRPLDFVHNIVTKYIQPKDDVTQLVDQFIEQNWPTDAYIIGIHYRGTDKVDAYPYVSPTFPVFDYYVQQVHQRYNKQNKPIHIYIATDSSDFIQWADKRWSGAISYYKDTPRLSSKDAEALTGGTHKNNKFTPYQKGLSSVLDCLLLSRTSYLIKNRSGLSDVAIWYGWPQLKFTFIIGANDPVYSTDMMPQPPTSIWYEDNEAYIKRIKQK